MSSSVQKAEFSSSLKYRAKKPRVASRMIANHLYHSKPLDDETLLNLSKVLEYATAELSEDFLDVISPLKELFSASSYLSARVTPHRYECTLLPWIPRTDQGRVSDSARVDTVMIWFQSLRFRKPLIQYSNNSRLLLPDHCVLDGTPDQNQPRNRHPPQLCICQACKEDRDDLGVSEVLSQWCLSRSQNRPHGCMPSSDGSHPTRNGWGLRELIFDPRIRF